MASPHKLNRPLDVAGAHRYMFFTSSSGSNRTKKGRQALTQKRTGGRLSSLGQSSNYSNTTDSTLSTIFQKTQSSSTQTDMRDSEIQTDPWWYRSEGVPLLCCRGSHRKLEKAKWNARASQGLFEQTIHDISQTESLITSTLDDGDAHTSSMTTSSQKTVSCGPSYGSRAYFPDPLDLWVSTYRKLRIEDEIQEEKIAVKRHRLLKRQQLLAIKRRKKMLTAGTHISKLSTTSSFPNRRCIPNILPKIKTLDNVAVNQALDHLCQQLHRHSLNQTYLNDYVEKSPPVS